MDNRTYGTRNSIETLVHYTQPRKPASSAEERKRNRKSLVIYKIGDDAK